MMRIFYWTCLLVLSLASPIFAKEGGGGVKALLPSKSGKGTIAVPTQAPDSAIAKAKEQPRQKPAVASHDVTRKPVSPALVVKQEVAAKSSSPVIRHNTLVTSGSAPVRTSSGSSLMVNSDNDRGESGGRLARVTAYWASEGDYYTGRGMSATGVRLHDGHCAVDPNIIPYGSVVSIAGVGRFLAVDTGTAVIRRTAAREGGHTDAERHAIVVDVFFEDSSKGQRFAAGDAKYVAISWYTPTAMNDDAKSARSYFADENWVKIQNKQL